MRLVLCDDHVVFLEALASALRARGHEVVATAHDPQAAVEAVVEHEPDICLIDLSFPEGSGLDAVRAVRERGLPTRLLVLSANDDPTSVSDAMEAGAQGFVPKAQRLDVVLEALERVAAGQVAVDPDRLHAAMRQDRRANQEDLVLRQLTQREREVLQQIVRGLSTAEIARELGISSSTARSHVQNVLMKLQVHSRLQAVALVTQRGAASAGF